VPYARKRNERAIGERSTSPGPVVSDLPDELLQELNDEERDELLKAMQEIEVFEGQ
jgi:hypothetical protein